MSLYIDKKYISLVAPKLLKYKQKSEYLWNFRCPICGDSSKNKIKARGYIYRRKSDLFFTCHNCGASHSFGNFLKIVDRSLYSQYQMDRYRDSTGGNTERPDFSFVTKQPVFKKPNPIKLPTIESLPEEHSARIYISKRKIPRDRWTEIYYANDFKKFVLDLLPDYDKSLRDEEPRIVFPFYDEEKKLLGLQGRAMEDSKVKYITIKVDDENLKLYGLDKLDKTKTIYVVEGPIDSMFINNCLATMDATLYNIIPQYGDNDYVFVYDNQPRNKEVVKHIQKTIEMGKKVCIWPRNVTEKDINDMVKNGMASVKSVIDSNTFTDHRAMLQFNLWKKQ